MIILLVLTLIGLYGVAVKRSLVKIVIGLMLMQYAVDLLLVELARGVGEREWFSQLAALAGLSTTIVLVVLIKRNKTLDAAKLDKLKG